VTNSRRPWEGIHHALSVAAQVGQLIQVHSQLGDFRNKLFRFCTVLGGQNGRKTAVSISFSGDVHCSSATAFGRMCEFIARQIDGAPVKTDELQKHM